MKKLIINTLLLICFVACSDDEECAPESSPYYGTANIIMNGQVLELGAVAGNASCGTKNLSLRTEFYDENGLRRMSIVIGNFPPYIGKYTLKKAGLECVNNFIYGSANTLDHDALIERFDIVEEADNNELIITHYDSVAARLEGHFSMTLAVKDMFRVDSIEFPDTLVIEYGTFSTEVLPPRE